MDVEFKKVIAKTFIIAIGLSVFFFVIDMLIWVIFKKDIFPKTSTLQEFLIIIGLSCLMSLAFNELSYYMQLKEKFENGQPTVCNCGGMLPYIEDKK